MSNTITSEACVLCDRSAEWLPGDYVNTRDYRCSNSDCGDYRVANGAIGAVKSDEALRNTAKLKANFAKSSGRVLIIESRSDAGVNLKIVDLSTIRFFRR